MAHSIVFQGETGGQLEFSFAIEDATVVSGYIIAVAQDQSAYWLQGEIDIAGDDTLVVSKALFSAMPVGHYIVLPQVVDTEGLIYFLEETEIDVGFVPGATSYTTALPSIFARVADIEAAIASGLGVNDHGALSGLSDDDHPQYLNVTRGDARYYTEAEIDGMLSGLSTDYNDLDNLPDLSIYAAKTAANTFTQPQKIIGGLMIGENAVLTDGSTNYNYLYLAADSIPDRAYVQGIITDLRPSSGTYSQITGVYSYNYIPDNPGLAVGTAIGLFGYVDHYASATINDVVGVWAEAYAESAGITNRLTGLYVLAGNYTAGTLVNRYGIRVDTDNNAGVSTNNYQIYTGNIANSAATNKYAIWTDGGEVRHKAGNAGTVAFSLQRAGSATAHLFNALDSDGTTVLSYMDKDGKWSTSAIPTIAYSSLSGTPDLSIYAVKSASNTFAESQKVSKQLALGPNSAIDDTFDAILAINDYAYSPRTDQINVLQANGTLTGAVSGNFYGLNFYGDTGNSTGGVATAEGISAAMWHSASYNIAGFAGAHIQAGSQSASTVTSLYGLRVSMYPNATTTTAYGLKVQDVAGAGTNYALYTGTGKVRFGDEVILTGALTLPAEAANTVFAGPTSGGSAVPAFRSLVAADLPAHTHDDRYYTESEVDALIAGTGSGSVTSVGMTVPSFLSVAGSPVTSAGTLAVTLATQAQNTIFAGPSTGADAAPAFRSLVAADIPNLSWSKITSGLPTTLSGYGITDAFTQAAADLRYSQLGHTHTFSSLTSIPTTVSGYGITDVYTKTTADARYGLLASGNIWTAAQTVKSTDSVTNTVTRGLTVAHNSSSTPAASFGTGILFNLHSDTTVDQNAAAIDTIWTTATHATRTSAIAFSTVDAAGSLTERLRIGGAASLAIKSTAGTTIWNFGPGGHATVSSFSGGTGLFISGGSATGFGVSMSTGAGGSFSSTSGLPLSLLFNGGGSSSGQSQILVLQRRTPSAAQVGAGGYMSFTVHTAAQADLEASRIGTIWTNPVDAARTSAIVFSTVLSGVATTPREVARITGSGHIVASGFYAGSFPVAVVGNQTLTDGVTIAWDVNNGAFAVVTLAGNRTLDNPTNMVAGASYALKVIQDGTGSRTLSYGSAYKWASGGAPTLSTAIGAIDILTFVSDGTNMYGSILKAFS